MPSEKLPHIVLKNPPETSNYTTTISARGDKARPARNRIPHGQFLQNQLNLAWQNELNEQAVSLSKRSGVYLEFQSDPNSELEIKSLENLRKRIRLLNVRVKSDLTKEESGEERDKITYATVYVPHAHKKYFLDKIEKYTSENTVHGKPRNAKLVESIADIRKALLVESFWSETLSTIPNDEPDWIEVWLSSDKDEIVDSFEELLVRKEIRSRDGIIKFPERVVKLVCANREQLETLTRNSDYIAEYRRAKTAATYWLDSSNQEQAEWVENLLARCSIDSKSQSSVCILDTGVNHSHPLLTSVISVEDCQSFDPKWGTHDHDKHGTLMAGVVAYGNLVHSLESSDNIEISHRLESVKILPPGSEENEAYLWGFITSQAISRAEIKAPNRNRSICMAVTAEDTRDRGRPSSWSAEIDQLSSGANDETQRLIILSVGNATDNVNELAKNYPDTQLTDSVHDPAQSWNAISVGGFTELSELTDPTLVDYKPVASKNELSPFSTTSMTWEENKWPIKPELVLEAGNLVVDSAGFTTECDDLSLLSTFYDPQQAYFSNFNMTSAATAQLGWMSGVLQNLNPDYWPETIRALLIHSAEWPEDLKRQFIDDDKKTSYKRLLSICGYGVPNLEQAKYSTQNSLTLIAQSTLQPFDKATGGYRTKDMHLHELPWPKEVLLNLPDETSIKMRVTLSYFIEPGPGEIGWKDRYRYASHALRFELNSPGESKSEFVKRINKAARNSDEDKPATKSPTEHWLLGSQARDRGSVHSDIWQGTSAELAASNLIAVSPTIGWWRERHHLERWNKTARYALIVSITTPDENVDIYTPVAVQVALPVAVPVSV